LEGESGLDGAGPLPLAVEPRFPDANRVFLERLLGESQRLGQLAMARAMASGGDGA
jgi:hypothetical protein